MKRWLWTAMLVPCLHAGVIFTNFQSSICCSLGVNNAGANPQSLAGAFIPTGDYIMTDAQVKVEENGTEVPTFNLAIYNDNGGVPGSSLGSLGTGTAPSAATFNIVTLSSPAISLLTGQTYWLVMTPNAGSGVFWAGGGFPVDGDAYASNPNGAATWLNPATTCLQFQIDGTQAPTPEPAALAMLGGGLCGLLLIRRAQATRR